MNLRLLELESILYLQGTRFLSCWCLYLGMSANYSSYIATTMNLSVAARRPDLHRIFNEAPPLGRVGQPEDLKMAVLYLLSQGSSYVSGLDLVVDGGMSVTSGNFKSTL